MSLLRTIYPLLAPLPKPFVEHLAVRLQRRKLATPANVWDLLEQMIQEKRRAAFNYMNPFVQTSQIEGVRGSQSRYSTAWLLRTLSTNSPNKKPISPKTLHDWHSRGLLHNREYGLPDYSSAAALFIARLIDTTGERNWLPSTMAPDEPAWWCWRQDRPDAPQVPCPVPIPADVPPSALLWTPWAGAAWEKDWLLIGRDTGAIRWAGTARVRGQRSLYWSPTLDDLIIWIPALTEAKRLPILSRHHHDENAEALRLQFLNTLATTTLYMLALTRFDLHL